jgi:serine/threonine-protein kinase
MWEEELSRRFTATTFVPLEPDRMLQNGKYKIVRQIAFGGFSAVYLAQRNDLDMVILKQAVLPPETDENARSAAERHLRRESEILSKIDHPGIVKVFDFFVEQGNYYLVMEHVSGQDLRQLIKQHGAQAPGRVVEWAEQIARTLEFLHAQSPPIVHRDASPDNIVVANDGSVRLIDFGASTEFITNATGTTIGKQAYTAPEQLRGKACAQSDIYALGATMFFCLTGKDPMALSTSHPRDAVPGLSSALDELVAECTALETADRLATMSSVKTRLQEVREEAESVKL